MQITKRNKTQQSFNYKKIEKAVFNCFKALGYKNAEEKAYSITGKVTTKVLELGNTQQPFAVPLIDVETIQNYVEEILLSEKELEAYHEYSVYRKERTSVRIIKSQIPDEVKKSFDKSKKYFPTPIQEWQFFDKYSRFNYEFSRRETWIETIKRDVEFLRELSENKLDEVDYNLIHDFLLNMYSISSLRLLAMAGDAARRDHISVYNCSFIPIGYVPQSDIYGAFEFKYKNLPIVKHYTDGREKNPELNQFNDVKEYISHVREYYNEHSVLALENLESFVEILYISMCGCGVGTSVEEFFTCRLPKVKENRNKDILDKIVEDLIGDEVITLDDLIKKLHPAPTFIIPDSTQGWCEALRRGLKAWFTGNDLKFDFSEIRPAGSVLKTKGGRASGPDPLEKMLDRVRTIVLNASGRQLFSDEISDIICCIGECAVSGGVRRTAIIIVYDFGDWRMRNYKQGNWYEFANWRSNANISEAFVKDYSQEEISNYVDNLDASNMGEPGIFSCINAIMSAPERRKTYWESILGFKITRENCVFASYLLAIRTNPCGEINLSTLCNLTAAVLSNGDDWEFVKLKVKVATMIGTIQSMATNFHQLRPHWKQICEEERLLGVDLIGQADYGFLSEEQFEELKRISITTNVRYANILGIQPSNAITTGKPAGNSGVLLNRSSGISNRKYAFSKRNVEVSRNTAIYKVLKHSKVPGFPKKGREESTYIFTFPLKAPNPNALQENDTLESQLDYWLKMKNHYTEHNPSCSIYYKFEELNFLKEWIFENQSSLGGLAFFPNIDLEKLNLDYLPEEKISEEEYKKLIEEFPSIDWELLWAFEEQDYTTASQQSACTADKCEWKMG